MWKSPDADHSQEPMTATTELRCVVQEELATVTKEIASVKEMLLLELRSLASRVDARGAAQEHMSLRQASVPPVLVVPQSHSSPTPHADTSSKHDSAMPLLPARELTFREDLQGIKEVKAASGASTRDGYEAVPTLEREDLARDAERVAARRRSRKSDDISSLPQRKHRNMVMQAGEVKPDDPCIQQIAASHSFDHFATMLVVLNAIWIGVQTEYAARYWTLDTPVAFHVVDWLFCVGFMFEVAVKIGAQGKQFFMYPEVKWNLLDLFVAVTQLIDSVVSLRPQDETSTDQTRSAYSVLGSLRMVRLVRIVRVARMAFAFRELRKLVISISASLASLGWTCLLIFLTTYAAAIVIMQLVNENKIRRKEEGEETIEEVIAMFGSLGNTLTTLYMVISEGIHWKEVLEPLEREISPWMRPAICLFVAFQLFAMMNIITAYFVEETLRQASKTAREEIAADLWAMIKSDAEMDENGNLSVTKDIFDSFEDHPLMIHFLHQIDCEQHEFHDLFNLIDFNGDGQLSLQEFTDGCGKLYGHARPSKVASLSVDQRVFRQQVARDHQDVMEAISSIIKRPPTSPARSDRAPFANHALADGQDD